jgi:hypothetical protein
VSEHLQRAFRAAIVAASALHCSGTEEGAGDASSDAAFGHVHFGIDASPWPPPTATATASMSMPFLWCEAGPPIDLGNLPPNGLCVHGSELYDVPCGVPLDWGCNLICPPPYSKFLPCLIVPTEYLVDGGLGDAAVDDAGVYVACDCNNVAGRRPAGYRTTRAPTNIGEYFANMARLEAASVFAFERLHDELEQMNAPKRLIARVRRSINDEHRHARIVERVAKRFGGVTIRPHAPKFRSRGMERFAIENAVEGCVREMHGALVATWQSMHARDPHVQRVMRTIARDETRHAALAMSVAAFVSDKLDEKSRVRVERARRRAISELRAAATRSPDRNLASVAGLPSGAQARALVAHFFGASGLAFGNRGPRQRAS